MRKAEHSYATVIHRPQYSELHCCNIVYRPTATRRR